MRPATVPEQLRWRQESLRADKMENPDTGELYNDDPDGLMVSLSDADGDEDDGDYNGEPVH